MLPTARPRSALLFLAPLCSLLAVPGGRAPSVDPAPRASPDQRQREMLAALGADGPHASLGAEAAAFDRFVGTWDAGYSVIAEDGSIRQATGEVRFGWILDGRALQDVWVASPAPGSSAEREIGTSVRFFDAPSRRWRVVWVAPSRNELVLLEGGPEGERIVLRGQDADGARLTWSFEELRPDSFRWKSEISRDGGKTWRLQEEHRMRRRAGGGG